MPQSPVTATGAPTLRALNVGPMMAGFNDGGGDILATEENVHAHLTKVANQSARVHAGNDPAEQAEVARFMAGVRAKNGSEWRPSENSKLLGTPAPHSPLHVTPSAAPIAPTTLAVVSDLDAAAGTFTLEPVELQLSEPAGGKKRGRGKGKMEGVVTVRPGTAAPGNEAGPVPHVRVEFDDDGRRQTIRVHAVSLTQDGQGLAMLTQLAPESRYFPRPDSVVTITTEQFGRQTCYCPGFHADFGPYGVGLSTYVIIDEQQAAAVAKEKRRAELAELKAMLAESEDE